MDIDKQYSQLLTDFKQLQNKCNKQLDYIKELRISLESITNGGSDKNTNKFYQYFNIFFTLINSIISDDIFIKPKKKTVTAETYEIIEYTLFLQYLTKFVQQEEQAEIINAWKILELITPAENNKTTFTYALDGKPIKSVRIRKTVVGVVKEFAEKSKRSVGK